MFWIIPIILFPYIFPLTGFALYSASGVIEGVFESIFLWAILLINLAAFLLAAVGTVVCLLKSLRCSWDPAKAAKANLTVKLAQLPAKILYLVVGIFCIILLPWAILVLVIFLGIMAANRIFTGTMGVGAVINLTKRGIAKTGELVPHAVLSFVSIADIVCAFLLHQKARQAMDLAFGRKEI